MIKINSSNMIDTEKHPCFNIEARLTNARVHLPVAPKCNIQCNYCNRKYDCVNESRPGVTSAVLSPHQAVEYLKGLNNVIENLTVVGIAGPGDPFANPQETLETMRLVRREFPEKIFCLSTNGLNLKPYIDEIAELGVTHVTITINAIDPDILAKIYAWVRDNKRVFRNREGAELILSRQLECIPLLKAKGMIVKINTVIIPGINDRHIGEIAKKVAELGADIMNCLPMVPNKETGFAEIKEPSKAMILGIRTLCKEHIEMMTHCSRCRADAAGLLGQDNRDAFGMIQEFASRLLKPDNMRTFVAVATFEGLLVNMHLGEAKSLRIYKQTTNGFRFVEERTTPESGSGDFRWINLANKLKDCRALLVSGVGPNPLNFLQHSGIRVIQMTGLIDEGLEAVFKGKNITTLKKTGDFKCSDTCGGTSQGCG
jgi:nitrogen fixation protein NifB